MSRTFSSNWSTSAVLLLAGVGSSALLFNGRAIAQITGQPTIGQPTEAPVSVPTGQPQINPPNPPSQPSQPNQQINPPTYSQPLDQPLNRPFNQPFNQPAQGSQIAPVSSVSNANYILGVGDQITLSVIGYPEFTGNLAILPDGTVTLPLVGPVRVIGLTPVQLSESLTNQLRTYLVDPVVSVGLSIMRPVVVTVAGEVHRPGPIQMGGISSFDGDVLSATETTSDGAAETENSFDNNNRQPLPTLSSAVLLAGGVTRDADIRQVMVRRPVAGGGEELLTLNLWDVVTSGVGPADVTLRDGDSIFIPRLAGDEIDRRAVASSSLAPNVVKVKVVGEVVTPGEVKVPPNSSISSAVAIAGGPTKDAALSNVSLVRQTESGQIEEEQMDLSSLVDDYQVQEGDVIVVAKRGYLSVIDGVTRVLNPLNLFRLLGF